MDKNLESWLRGEAPDRGAPHPEPVPGADQAALLGLPVAPLGSGRSEILPDPAEEEEPAAPAVTLTEQELIIPPEDEKEPEAVPDMPEPESETPSSFYVQADEVVGGEAEIIPPVMPRLFAERRKPDRAGRGKKLAAAGFTAAAIAAGAWLLIGRESAADLLVKGRELYGGGDYEGALECYSRAAEKDPALLEALLGVADALERLDRRGEAVDAYYKCLQVAHDDPAVHAKLGFLFLSMSSYENALRSFHESINFNPGDSLVFAGMGRAYEAREDYAQAVSAYRKALDLSASEENRTALDRAEKELSRQNEESERRQRDILVKENVLQGMSALSLGNFDESRSFFLKALELTPSDHDALMGMGSLNKAAGDPAAAADYFRAVLAFHPDSALAAEALAEIEKDPVQLPEDEELPKETGSGDKLLGLRPGDDAPAGDKPIPEIDKGEEKEKNNVKKPDVSTETLPKSLPQEKAPPPPLVPSGRGTIAPALKRPVPARAKVSEGAKPVPVPAATRAKQPVTGVEELSRGDYPAAFSLFWKEMLTPTAERPAKAAVSPPPLKNAPFSEGRWRDITPVREGPLGGRMPLAVTLPEGDKQTPRWAADKAALVEAIRVNPEDGPVYLNLALSYLLQKEDNKKTGQINKAEEEKAVYFSMLAHAWLRKGERDKAAIFLNAAKLRARGEILERVISLEKIFLGRNGRGT